jgi:Ankyrin repeats (3 copies)/Ankyrin repeat
LKNENVEMDLAASVYTDDVAAVRRELAERPDRAFERSRGQSLLHKAVSAETVSLLLAAGVGVDDREERGGFTPLFRAIQSASLPAVSALLKHGADPNARGDDGSAPLHKLTSWAPRDESQVGEVEAIGRLLIDAGAMIEPIARDGTTPLRLAARHGRLRLVRLLVAVGADPLLRDLYGSNALDESRPHPEVAKWLRGWAVHNGVSFAPKVSAADVVDLPHGMLRFHQATDRALAMAGPSVITGWATDGQPELRFFAVSDLAEIIDLAFAPDALLWETKIDGHITGTMDSLNTIDLPMGYRTDIAFSIDSTRIAIGLDERLVELDAATGTVITVQTALGRLSSVVASASVHGWITAGTTGVCLVTRPSR